MPIALMRSLLAAAALIRRNCTESGWSFPSPLYGNACELEAIGSSNDTEDKARGSPGGCGTGSPFLVLTHAMKYRGDSWGYLVGLILVAGLPRGITAWPRVGASSCHLHAHPNPCCLTPLVLSLPERLFCHHEGALHLRLLHIPGSPDPGHRHLLLLQVGLGAGCSMGCSWREVGSTLSRDGCSQSIPEQPGSIPANMDTRHEKNCSIVLSC